MLEKVEENAVAELPAPVAVIEAVTFVRVPPTGCDPREDLIHHAELEEADVADGCGHRPGEALVQLQPQTYAQTSSQESHRYP